jgi:capsular exopolysaccharide synthesis family protein
MMFAKKKKSINTVVANQIKTSARFQVEEAYKAARANISFSIIKEGCKKILITSSLSHEGKSTTASNLAITLSEQVGTKVLLIDCDLRKPRVFKFFNRNNTPGLTDYLSGFNTLDEALSIIKEEDLHVLCAVTIPPNPSELLSSNKFAYMLTILEEKYDYIIIDTPPLNVVSDALPIAKICDGVVLSVMQNQSKHPDIKKTVDTLDRLGIKILGFVLNGVKDKTKSGYGYDYSYSYSQGNING